MKKKENKSLKILFITHYVTLYGANKSLLNLLDGLSTYNVEPYVMVPENGEICSVLEEKKIPFLIQNFEWWCGLKQKSPKKGFKRSFVIKKKWFDNISRQRLNRANLKKLNQKLNFSPDVICSNSSVFNFGLLMAKTKNLPHIWFVRESQEQYNLQWHFNNFFIKNQFNSSEVVIAVSQFLKNYFEEKYKIKRTVVLYNGVLSKDDLILLDLKREIKKEEKSAIVFGLVGLIHEKKGQKEAILAFSLVNKVFPETKLIIVGLGDQRSLKQLAINNNLLDKIEFWGHVQDPFDAFLAMDVCLMCSRMEGLGRVTIEAMAANIPIIGYKEGGTEELIVANENGLFYENGYKELAEKMKFLIENPEVRERMGNRGREIFKEKFTSEICAYNFYNIIRSRGLI